MNVSTDLDAAVCGVVGDVVGRRRNLRRQNPGVNGWNRGALLARQQAAELMLLSGQLRLPKTENPVIRPSKKQPFIAAIIVAIFAATPAILLAQTETAAPAPAHDIAAEVDSVGASAAPETTAPVLDVAVQVEMERRFNKFRSQYLDDRADTIGWWLGAIALVLGFFALLVPVVGYLGYRKFLTSVEDEARKSLDKIKGHEEQAGKTLEALRKITIEDVADPAKAEQVEKVVDAVRQAPDASPIDKAIAMAHSLQKSGEIEKAIEKWHAIAHLMEGEDNQVAARAWFLVGYLIKSPEEKDHAYSQTIRLEPRAFTAYNNRGDARFKLKQYDAAIEDYNSAIRLDPQGAAAYSNRGNIKLVRKQHEDAIDDYDKAIRLDSKNIASYFGRGKAKIGLKRYESAIEDFDKAVHLNPRFDEAYYNRGIAKYSLKRVDEARPDFQIALRLAKEQGNEELATDITSILRKMDNSEKN